MKKHDRLWLAGLLEGEGCFSKRKNSNSIVVRLEMTDKDVVLKVVRLFRSKLRLARKDKRKNRKRVWLTYLCGDKAVPIMKAILPFMGKRRTEKILELLRANQNKGNYRPPRKIGRQGTSWCSACKSFRSNRLFSRDLGRWNGLQTSCKQCYTEKWGKKRSVCNQ